MKINFKTCEFHLTLLKEDSMLFFSMYESDKNLTHIVYKNLIYRNYLV